MGVTIMVGQNRVNTPYYAVHFDDFLLKLPYRLTIYLWFR